MSLSRIEEKKSHQSNQQLSGTATIQKQLQKKFKFDVQVDHEMLQGQVILNNKRHADVQKIGEDAKEVLEMTKDLAQLIQDQEPDIQALKVTLESAHVHTEKAEKELSEAEKRWCVIL